MVHDPDEVLVCQQKVFVELLVVVGTEVVAVELVDGVDKPDLVFVVVVVAAVVVVVVVDSEYNRQRKRSRELSFLNVMFQEVHHVLVDCPVAVVAGKILQFFKLIGFHILICSLGLGS